MPSISQAATPMKPRANPGNRTRQPKGCADRIAKPARLSRTSQNHLMTIILNKTGAATVAQHDCEPLAVHAQSETAARKRHVLCANFSKTRALFLLLSHRPQRKGRAGAPHGGGSGHVAHVAVVLWSCFGVSCGICAGAIVLMPRLAIAPGHRIRRVCRAWPSCRGRGYGVPGRGRRAWVRRPWPPSPCLCCLWTCRRRVVATRRRMLVFAMVLAWSVLTQFALHT